MTLYVLCVIPPSVVYLTVPSAHVVAWALVGLLGVGAVLLGVRIHRPARVWPWLLLAAANLTFTSGDTAYNLIQLITHEDNPFPSVADVFYLATYPLFALGIYGFIRYRCKGRDLADFLDALILTLGLALLFWGHLISPLTMSAGQTWVEKSISIAYPLGDVLVLAMLTRLLAAGGHQGRSVQLLTLGTGGLLVSDVLYGLLQLNGTWAVGTYMDIGWIVFFTAWGLAALHPSMVQLTEPVRQQELGTTKLRLAMLTGAALVAPMVLLAETVGGSIRDAAVTAVLSGVMMLLVMARLWLLVSEHRKSVSRERSLREAAASLVGAVNPEDVARSVEEAMTTLFGPEGRHEVVLFVADGKKLRPVSTSMRPWAWTLEHLPAPDPTTALKLDGEGAARGASTPVMEPALLALADVGPLVAELLAPLPKALYCPLLVGTPGTSPSLLGALLVAGHEKDLTRLGVPTESLAAQAAAALARLKLNEEINRRKSDAYFRTLVHNASDVILILDDDDVVSYASPSAEGMFGTAPLPGTPLRRLVDAQDHVRVGAALNRVRSEGVRDVRDYWLVVSGEKRLDIEVRCSNLRHEQTVNGVVLTLRDMTEQRALERELTHRAFHDSLTGLPNRVLLQERIERSLIRGRRDGTLTSVLFLDLDDFKVINDMMGHPVGDELLVAVARRLSGVLRQTDTAARLGGDEFAILMEGTRSPDDAERLAGQVVQSFGHSFHLSSGPISVSGCVGVTTAQADDGAEDLLGQADLALYAAKTAGKRQWQRYRPELHAGLVEQHELRSGLDGALHDGSFTLRYQPIVDILSGAVAGFEALVRWPHRSRGLVPPEEFISLAEETGHIVPLGAWVLEQAATEVSRWQATGTHGIRLNVNVSARQFLAPDFVDQVRRVLEISGLDPSTLVLEMTESVLLRRNEQVRASMRTLKSLGVSIAIDDFGTGFSSLSYLREFPIDLLKVDKSFIDNIVTDGQQVALVEGIVRIADVLGLQVVAEGIENVGQRDLLTAMGCRFGQGFLFARPMTAEDAQRYLRKANDRSELPMKEPHDGGVAKARTVATTEKHIGDLARLKKSSPMSDAVIDEVHGRRIRCGDKWLIDFASCNYLGFDFDEEIMDSIAPTVRRWGTHPSWSRLIGTPSLYTDIEEHLAELLGAPDTLLLPTITLIHGSVIPALADGGEIFLESRAHRTIYDGCVVARAQGATVQRFHGDELGELEEMLTASRPGVPRIVCIDGVNSMSGNLPDLVALAALCRTHDALLYVDDAHGFGIVGERRPDETSPYGSRGNSIVKHLGESYDGIMLVGGFSKAYSSLLAFLTAPPELKDYLKVAAGPYLYSGPVPVAALATARAGLRVNDERGDAVRQVLYSRTQRVLDHLRDLDAYTPNTDGLPIIEIPLADSWDLDAVGDFLWDRGIYVTLAAYPLVPRDQVGFRIQITALNTEEHIDELNAVLTELADRFPLKQRLAGCGGDHGGKG